MSDLKALVDAYVDDSVDRSIREWIEIEGYQDLFDVQLDSEIMRLLGLDTLSPRLFKRVLFERGYFTQVPLQRMVDDIGSSITNPYFDSKIVGDKVEEHRLQVVESDEFAKYVCDKYDSLYDVGRNAGLKSFLDPSIGVNSLKKALFEVGLLTEFPVAMLFRDGSMKRRTSPYLNPKIVGDMVENYRRFVLRSDELREWVEARFDSLYDIGNERALASILGVSMNQTLIRGVLFKAGILTEIPFDKVIEYRSASIVSPYLDERVVGDDVELNREKILRSDEFGDFIRTTCSSLEDISKSNKGGLARLLGVEPRIVAVREELVRMGFYG